MFVLTYLGGYLKGLHRYLSVLPKLELIQGRKWSVLHKNIVKPTKSPQLCGTKIITEYTDCLKPLRKSRREFLWVIGALIIAHVS